MKVFVRRVRARASGPVIVEVAGFAAVAFGAGQVYEPAGWIVGGVLAWIAAQGMAE